MNRRTAKVVRSCACSLAAVLACAGCYDGAFEGARSESNRVQNRIENDPLTQRLRGSGPAASGSAGSDAGVAPTEPPSPAPLGVDAGKTGSDIEI